MSLYAAKNVPKPNNNAKIKVLNANFFNSGSKSMGLLLR